MSSEYSYCYGDLVHLIWGAFNAFDLNIFIHLQSKLTHKQYLGANLKYLLLGSYLSALIRKVARFCLINPRAQNLL